MERRSPAPFFRERFGGVASGTAFRGIDQQVMISF